jgi:acetyl-CoA C-acetyltransferase
MHDISIIGLGMTPVAEHWGRSLRELGQSAIQAALDDAGVNLNEVDALSVGNALGGNLNRQNHVAALVADYAGLRGAETAHLEGGEASGGLALRHGLALIGAGLARVVVVLGLEKVTDRVGADRNEALTSLLDAEYEAAHGATPTAMAALLMRRYMHEYGLDLNAFEGFSLNAHSNGAKNPNAMYRNVIKAGKFASAPMVADPVNLFDSAPEGDGACALVLMATESARDRVPAPIRVRASAVASDIFALHDRPDPLFLAAVNVAAGRAYHMAGVRPQDVHLAELHDSYTVMSALQLEAAGFAERGTGWKLAVEGALTPTGRLPISTFGGLKARGNPLGATGVYQVAEVALQLRGAAGANQIEGARLGLALNMGGLGTTAVAHLLERVD